MSQPGMGVMIGYLGGNRDTVDAYHASMNKLIVSAELVEEGDGALVLRFADGTGLRIYDNGRSCCESRYITCDDDLSKLVGGNLTGIEQKPAPDLPDEYGESHETMFVEIQTDSGSVTLTTHNEHNGYYGGFWLELRSIASGTEARSDATGTGAAEGDGPAPKGDAQGEQHD